jgi:amino acid adenylation domain-containing protein
MSEPMMQKTAGRAEVDAFLDGLLEQALPTAPDANDRAVPFLEMGANSLILMELQRAVETRYGLTLGLAQFFEELTNMEALAEYIDAHAVTRPGVSAAAASTATPVVASGAAPVPAAPTLAPTPVPAPAPALATAFPSHPVLATPATTGVACATRAAVTAAPPASPAAVMGFPTGSVPGAPAAPLESAPAPAALPSAAPWAPLAGSPALAGGESLEAFLGQQMEITAQALQRVVSQQLQFLAGMGNARLDQPALTVPAPASLALSAAAVPAAPLPPAAPPGVVTPPATIASLAAAVTPTGVPVAAGASPAAAPSPVPASPPASASAPAPAAAAPRSGAAIMHKMLSPLEIRARGLTEQQSCHLEVLIRDYTARTQRSKAMTAEYRPILADSRAAVGFRFTTKEMLYPIVGAKARGARVWDVDGNEYIDITMGQGVTLFGHRPDFLEAALQNPEHDGLLLGPRPPQVGEAAALLCELTGMERVTFTNTGTEAVMAALRIARTVTRRNRIIMFEGAYHGHADNVMGRSQPRDGGLGTAPVAPGIPAGAVEDLWVLEYGTDESLDFIRAHAGEVAAVIVEPVQSRRPVLQPREFLQEVRRITAAAGALLIFDEMITGFRIHPGGAQAWFDVRADLATYGKVLGGGMPIGVVAGRAQYMDAIDGGRWQYGDASYPAVDRTVFGGTFCQHPTAMIAVLAVLRHLKEQGPGLQEALNRRTAAMAETLNEFFSTEDIPIRVVYFGSLFRFDFTINLELLFYHMMQKGVFIWEWRNYFLSTAHTDADIAHIIRAVKESVLELRAGGFLPERAQPQPLESRPALPEKAPESTPEIVPDAVISRNAGLESLTAILPLTEAQRQLMVLAQLAPEGSMAYHVSPLLRLQGELRSDVMETALSILFVRHEALRTRVDGDRQRVLEVTQLPGAGALQMHDLTRAGAPDLDVWLRQLSGTPFHLERGPLFEAHLLRLAPTDWRLVLKGHHIIIDGLSMNLIVQELATLYNAVCMGKTPHLPPPVAFRDYVAWRGRNRFPEQESHWLQELAGAPTSLHLPADYPEAVERSYRGQRYTCAVPEALLQDLRVLSRTQGCTLHMTLMAAYALWLHRLCSQSELLVGVPVAGRGMPDADALVGYCTHLIPIRSRVQWEQPFSAYLKSMRGTLLRGYAHQDLSLAELMARLRARGEGDAIPRIGTVFNLDRPGAAPVMKDLDVEWLSQPIQYTPFDLTMNLTELGDAMVLECDFSLDRFLPSSIARYVGHFLTLLQGIVAAPETPVQSVPLLALHEPQAQWVAWNQTATEYPRDLCLPERFAAQVARDPAAIALHHAGNVWTFAELNATANRIAHGLRAEGMGPEAVIGVCLERSPTMVAALLGVLKAGAAFLPLDPVYPASRIQYMLEDSGAPMLLTQAGQLERLIIPEGVRTWVLDAPETAGSVSQTLEQYPETNPAPLAEPAHLAYLMYTSGSTGRPKGVMIEHRNLMNYLHWAVERYEVAAGAGAPLHSSISFDATLTALFTPLLAGRPVWILPEGGVEIEHIQAALQGTTEFSLFKMTPAHMELINAERNEADWAGHTRFLVLGGEALLARQVAPWRRHAPATRIINEYGPTETVVGCCVHEIDETDTHGAMPIGRPIANTRLYVLDARLQPVPVGVPGELFIGGEGVSRGYHHRPVLTAERFIEVAQTGLASCPGVPQERLYRTGDLVRYREDGCLLYLGRTDNQIKLRGFRIELGEIEAALADLPEVREAAVLVHRRSEQDVRLIAYVVPEEGRSPEPIFFRSALAAQLPEYMVPQTYVQLDKLPLNANGKVDRAALPLPEGLRAHTGTVFVDPRSEAEQRIAAIWREVLGVEKIGVEDSFFDLGGHSLLVLPLRDHLQAAFQKPVTAVDIFRYPTVAAQSRFLSGTETVTPAAQDARQIARRRREALRGQRGSGTAVAARAS